MRLFYLSFFGILSSISHFIFPENAKWNKNFMENSNTFLWIFAATPLILAILLFFGKII